MKKFFLSVFVLFVISLQSCILVEVILGNTATIVVQHRINEYDVDSTTKAKVEDIRVKLDGHTKILDSPTSTDVTPIKSDLWEVTWYGEQTKDYTIDYNYDYFETNTITGLTTTRVEGSRTIRGVKRGDYINVRFHDDNNSIKITISVAKKFWEE